MKKTMLSIVMMLCCVLGYAQELPKIIPPSPEVSSFVKNVEIPISLQTGLPNINVPLYKVNSGDVTVPINLSYNAKGVKVEEIASRVGLGWNINAGGVVTRVVKGLPDDRVNGYMNTDATLEILGAKNDYTFDIQHVLTNERDYEPDVFYFNFPGLSGRFIYDQTKSSFMQTPLSDVKIAPVFNNDKSIKSWVITSPEGVKYYFGRSSDNLREAVGYNSNSLSYTMKNNQMMLPNTSGIGRFASAWHLLEIISPTGNKVSFYYKGTNTVLSYLTRSNEEYVTRCEPVHSVSFSMNSFEELYLDKIEFKTGRVVFKEGVNDRKDLKGNKALQSIEVYNTYSKIKQVDFEYEYTESIDKDNIALGDSNQRKFRIFLKSISENSGSDEKKHHFEYDPTKLPNRLSYAQDYWGYYNGKTSNLNLIPKVFTSPTSTNNLFSYGFSDRHVDTLKNQAGILKKIIYPTGGSASFFYETNKVNKSNLNGGGSGNEYLLKNYEAESIIFYRSDQFIDNSGLQLFKTYSKSFTVPINSYGLTTFTTQINNCSNLDSFDCSYRLKVKGISNPNFEETLTSLNAQINLPQGEYKILAEEMPLVSNGDFHVKVEWVKDFSLENLYVGGLRVKKVVHENVEGAPITKQISYNQFNNSVSSGYLLSKPVFVDRNFINGLNCEVPTEVVKIYSFTQAPLAASNYLQYENVTEILTNKSKIEHTFSRFVDHPHATGKSAGDSDYLVPKIYVDWLRGKPLLTKQYRFYDNVWDLVEETKNVYQRTKGYMINLSGFKVYPQMYKSTTAFIVNDYFYSAYTDVFRLSSTINKSYYENNPLITTANYFYDNLDHLQQTRVEKTNSTGNILVNKTIYPQDKALPTPVEQNLIDSHQFVPLETSSYIDYNKDGLLGGNELLSKQNTIYKNWGNNIIAPEKIQTLKGGSGKGTISEDRVVYHSYDDKGNPTEVSKKDGTHIIYIWGYNQTQPIAKIENATLSQVSSYIGNIQTKSNADNDRTIGTSGNEGALRTALNNLRASLPEAQVTTYTYDPLIGVTSITDPRGQTVYYVYDSFNRLEFVKDKDGNILKENQYNYKN